MDSQTRARLDRVLAMPVSRGTPRSIEEGVSIAQAVAYVSGEAWSDSPACVCPVLLNFVRTWSEGLDADDDRTRLLRPFIPRLLHSRAAADVQQRRAWLALDWLVRARTTKWLALVPAQQRDVGVVSKLQQSLSSVRPICDLASAVRAGEVLHAVENEAMALWYAVRPEITADIRRAAAQAARASAWDAAWTAWSQAFGTGAPDAAWKAAGALAWAAAWDTMWAARAAALSTTAAQASAQPAALGFMTETVHSLQGSASDLLARMLVVGVTASQDTRTEAA